jgi:hypothetical protein
MSSSMDGTIALYCLKNLIKHYQYKVETLELSLCKFVTEHKIACAYDKVARVYKYRQMGSLVKATQSSVVKCSTMD